MKIIIVGCGKVGFTLVEQLTAEGHDIVAIDEDREKVSDIAAAFDVIGIAGNGVSFETLKEADIAGADLLIAVTGSDEHNLLCCMIARKTGNCQTIARVRNPIYHNEVEYLRKEFDLAMVLNPESAAAREISHIIRFPFAQKIDTFAGGHINLVHFKVNPDSVLVGRTLQEIRMNLKSQMLVCLVSRDKEVYIPNGEFRIQAGDVLGVVAEHAKVNSYFRQLSIFSSRVKTVMILGGGRTAYYLAKLLLKIGLHVKMVEIRKERCEELCDLLPKAVIIHGDATDESLLLQEGIEDADAIIAMTNMDEENILLSMFCKDRSRAKVITRINRVNFSGILDQLPLDSIVYPRLISADYITRFVRSTGGSLNSNVAGYYSLAEGRAEALEFYIKEASPVTGIPLQQLHIRKNTLICCIYRGGQVIIPSGQDCIMPGDSVIVILKDYKISNIVEILT